MRFFRTTKKHSEYWRNRVINWEESYTSTWNHPHRALICEVLKTIPLWKSIFEIGCGAGANLIKIFKTFEDVELVPGLGKGPQVAGVDINGDAIKEAKRLFTNANFKVRSGDDTRMSDSSTDVVLTDRVLIYVSPRDIDRYIEEIKRIGRKWIVLCEFHETSWFKRIKLRFVSGYFAHDYVKLLQRHGFYDIILYRIPISLWPGDSYPSYIIKAKILSRK